jgi:hypothetical protein
MPDQDYVHISPALERALFLKFAACLRILLYIAIPVVGGIATLAVLTNQTLTNKTVADAVLDIGKTENMIIIRTVERFAELEKDARNRLLEFERTAQETTLKAKTSLSEAEQPPNKQKMQAKLLRRRPMLQAI